MRIRFLSALTLLLVLVSSPAHAQAITSWTITIYAGSEGSTVVKTVTINFAAAQCNIDPATTQPVDSVRWDDTVTLGRKCQWVDQPFFNLAPGNYRGGMKATNATGTSPESLLSPFTVVEPLPAVPTAVVFNP
jgi:hypothetical protein